MFFYIIFQICTINGCYVLKNIIFLITLILIVTNISFSSNPDSGLIAYYPFNGNTKDESGNGNNGTNNGAVLTSDRFGTSGRAYSFNLNYIEIPNSPSLKSPVNSVTLSFWTNISMGPKLCSIHGKIKYSDSWSVRSHSKQHSIHSV
ncbi:MAG: hypothetical protein IPI04_16720 [Ignavibacteria bacterium]|nr:hypothetical protein [Ignavibacteria bacterium]